MMRYTLLMLFVLPITSALAAPDLECSLSESRNGAGFELPLHMDLSQRVTGTIPFTTPGSRVPGSVSVMAQNSGRISLLDPESGSPAHVTFSAAPGASSRLLLMGKDTDSIQIDCARAGDIASTPALSHLSCEMTEELLGNTLFSTKFQVPMSASGHDVQNLPPATLTGTAGWVLGYNGIIVIFFRNQTSGITAMGSWNGAVSASWSPGTDLRMMVSCEGTLPRP